MTITTEQAAMAAATSLHAFSHGPASQAARAELSQGGVWTLTALHRAVRLAYPHAEPGPRLAPASLSSARNIVSELHSFLCEDLKRATREWDSAAALIDVAGAIAFAACLVLDDDERRSLLPT